MTKRLTVRALAAALLVAALSLPALAQEKLDLQMLDRIRNEGLASSKIADFLIYLCDVYGPRLPDSPQYVKAGEWVVARAKELGLVNAAMEPYGTFGRSWELQKYYAAMLEPQYMPIIGYPKAWTPGTNGKSDARSVNPSPTGITPCVTLVAADALSNAPTVSLKLTIMEGYS